MSGSAGYAMETVVNGGSRLWIFVWRAAQSICGACRECGIQN